jgi:hypothetical protein
MLMHRPYVTGLFGMAACLGLISRLYSGPLEEPVPRAAEEAPAEAGAKTDLNALPGPCVIRSPAVNVVDVAAGAATPELVAQLIRIARDERIIAVDDHPVANDVAAGAWIAARFQREAVDPEMARMYPRGPIRSGDYIDVTIDGRSGEGRTGSRRLLVLFH